MLIVCLQNVFIGGGSQGLGLALACRLAARGAHVTIVSRSQNKLDIALKEVEVSNAVLMMYSHICVVDAFSSFFHPR